MGLCFVPAVAKGRERVAKEEPLSLKLSGSVTGCPPVQ